MAISGNQVPPARVRQREEHARRLAHLMRDAIRRTQTQSEVMRDAIRRTQIQSNPSALQQLILNPNHQPSAHHAVEERERLDGNQKQSEAIRRNPSQSEAIRGNQ